MIRLKEFTRILVLPMATIACLIVIVACATTSAQTSSTIGVTCAAIAQANTAFQTFAAAHPGKIDANGMSTEGAIMSSVGLDVAGKAPPLAGSVCAPPYQVTTAVAETTVIGALLNIANLVATWQK